MPEEEIDNLAALARIQLPAGEKESLARDLARILDYVSELKQASQSETLPPLATLYNVWREDIDPHQPDAYRLHNGYIKVKKIL